MSNLERLIAFLDQNKDCMSWHERLKYPFWKWAARKAEPFRQHRSKDQR